MYTILRNKAIGQVTYFYRFYLTRAMVYCGMADRYYRELTPWQDMINLGLTTFAEKPEPTRSDGHGWSASPNYEFLATICGIKPLTPGFNSILIQHALESFKW
jgi:alpha-L-rhamnosidase